jgi:hypothetical protein
VDDVGPFGVEERTGGRVRAWDVVKVGKLGQPRWIEVTRRHQLDPPAGRANRARVLGRDAAGADEGGA